MIIGSQKGAIILTTTHIISILIRLKVVTLCHITDHGRPAVSGLKHLL